VLFLLVLTEFPFPLSKDDKNSLAKVLAHGNRTADHWVSEGADFVFQSGDMRILVECKIFRDTVEKNVAAFRWGKERITSSPDVLGGEPLQGNTNPFGTRRGALPQTRSGRTRRLSRSR
jgi:hypothetical protein